MIEIETRPIMHPEEYIDIFIGMPETAKIIGLIILIFLLCFNVFTFILFKQVNVMSRNVITTTGKPIKLIAKAFIVIGIVLTFAVLLLLL
jgi:hypothetical protein